MTVIAHLTDIHLPAIPKAPWSEMNLKQTLGLINWHLSRKYKHRRAALDLLLSDLKEQTVSHFMISGDLVNLGLKEEFAAGLAWMDELGGPSRISFVPGNHDYYGDSDVLYEHKFQDYMSSDALGASLGGGTGPDEPFVRIIDEVALIGINSAIPTPLFKAYGEVSETALDQLGKVLAKAKAHGFYRCVIVHHPPLQGLTVNARAMNNDEAFTSVLLEAGAELVLYGHNHLQRYNRLTTVDGSCHVFGAPSASIGQVGKYDLARYNLFQIEPTDEGWRTEVTGRGVDPELASVGTVEHRSLNA